MLYIIKTDNTEMIWHVGDFKIFNLDTIKSIEVDGDELQLILTNFENIPKNKNSIQFWFGEMAIYIYNNLP